MTCGTVVVVGAAVTVVLVLPDLGRVVEAITANVVTVTFVAVVVGATVVVAAPLIVLLRLAFPWKTARIFFDVLLSRSGRITAAWSIMVPVPGIV